MGRVGHCSECGGTVRVQDDGSCAWGHPASCVDDVREVPDPRPASKPVTPEVAPSGPPSAPESAAPPVSFTGEPTNGSGPVALDPGRAGAGAPNGDADAAGIGAVVVGSVLGSSGAYRIAGLSENTDPAAPADPSGLPPLPSGPGESAGLGPAPPNPFTTPATLFPTPYGPSSASLRAASIGVRGLVAILIFIPMMCMLALRVLSGCALMSTLDSPEVPVPYVVPDTPAYDYPDPAYQQGSTAAAASARSQCNANVMSIMSAYAAYEADHETRPSSIRAAVVPRYMASWPVCPSGGTYVLVQNGDLSYVQCTRHTNTRTSPAPPSGRLIP